MNKPIQRIIKLTKRLNEYRDAYYNLSQPVVTDKEYDDLFDELWRLEEENDFFLSDSPSISVGYEVKSELKKVEHNHPMLSLAKTKDVHDLAGFVEGHEGIIMPKMDGLTISLKYKGGFLVGAETRGNGHIGEDILHNAKVFKNLPLHIPVLDDYIIDGEAIIPEYVFNRINKELAEHGEQQYKNARNLASGSVRQLDSKVAASRDIRFIAWKVVAGDDSNSFSQRLCNAEDMGFEVVPYYTVLEGTTEDFFEEYIQDLKDDSKSKGYGIDGMVVSYDDIQYGKSLGQTSHHVKYQIAYKFYDEEQETTLRQIEWSTSRTGQINPVAVFDSVEIDGTTVEKASLSNVSIIKELELGIGDAITVIKANQIIPKITANITRSGTYEIPEYCPSCGNPAVIKNDNGREVLYCENPDCAARIHDKIVNFCGKHGMDIRGLSEERIGLLIATGFITDFASVYLLKNHCAELEQLEGFGKASVAKLLDAIEDSRRCKLEQVIVAIGIPNIGKSMAKQLARYVQGKHRHVSDSNNKWHDNPFVTLLHSGLTCSDWTGIPDFGETTSRSINNYIRENWAELKELIPILDVQCDSDVGSNCLAGQIFCITGELNLFKNRKELEDVIEQNGGKVVTGVTRKTNYLIANDKKSGSTKTNKAQRFGTTIITEEDFKRMIP